MWSQYIYIIKIIETFKDVLKLSVTNASFESFDDYLDKNVITMLKNDESTFFFAKITRNYFIAKNPATN